MTNQQYSITPSPKLIEEWVELSRPSAVGYADPNKLATLAAQWGADKELEACVMYWMTHGITPHGVVGMREHRRPKPPSLKEQALTELNLTADLEGAELSRTQVELIRRALEALDD